MQRLKLRASLHCRSSRCVPLVQHTMLVTIADEARMCWHTLSATWATQSGVAKGHDEWLVTGLLGKFNVAFVCYILRRRRRLRLPKGGVVLPLSRRNWWKGKRPDLQLKRPQSRWVPSQSHCPATPCPVLLARAADAANLRLIRWVERTRSHQVRYPMLDSSTRK